MSLYNFYRSDNWTNLLQVLKIERLQDGQLYCAECGKPIVKAYDCIGHHVIELTEENYTDANISLNPDNIRLVHHKCHNIIHNKLGYSQRQVYIVYGAPLSGKTSWVKDNMIAGDLIIDIDSIYEAVSGCERYIKPNRLTSVVFSVRDCLIEAVKYRRGKWLNAYIIGGYPYEVERKRLADMLGAREIFIEATEDECIARLQADTGRDKDEWLTYIHKWFLSYSGKY